MMAGENVKKIDCQIYAGINTNEISKVSWRGAERRSNPTKDEIAMPSGLAMHVKIIIVLVIVRAWVLG